MDKIFQGFHIHLPEICQDIEDLIQSTMKKPPPGWCCGLRQRWS